jgi:hypothetical protein
VSADHPRAHEELLRAVRAGERDAAEPEFRELLRSCESCAASWGGLEDVAARLSATAREQRSAIASAAARPPGPGEDRIDATLARLAREEPHRAPRRSLARVWLVAAAVLLAGALAWRLVRPPAERGPDVPLGPEDLRLLEPIGTVRVGDVRFRWEYDEPAASFELVIDVEGQDEPIAKRVQGSEWIPGPEDRSKLTGRIRWTVNPLDDAGEQLDSRSETAELLP